MNDLFEQNKVKKKKMSVSNQEMTKRYLTLIKIFINEIMNFCFVYFRLVIQN